MTEARLRARIRFWTWFLIVGLVVSGLTALPLRQELELLVRLFDPRSALGIWLARVHAALADVDARWPFLALGTDWLAFGHLVIALGFVGLLRDPVRNAWLVTWGIWACVLVVPWAWGCGLLRGIPWGWRLVDASFGVGGLVPLLILRDAIRRLEAARPGRP